MSTMVMEPEVIETSQGKALVVDLGYVLNDMATAIDLLTARVIRLETALAAAVQEDQPQQRDDTNTGMYL